MAKKPADTSESPKGKVRGGAKAAKAPKEPKVKKQRFARARELKQAYTLLKPNDPKLGLFIGLAALGGFLIGFFLMTWLAGWGVFGIIFAVIAGLLLGMLAGMAVFGIRARKTTFAQAEGRPGAAAWAMEQLRGDWRISQATSANTQRDIVHRVIGRPGVVLVGEVGSPRIGTLLGQEKKKIARVIGDTPIYTIIVGDDEGQVPLKKLNRTIMKLPRNIKGAQIRAVEKRLQAIAAPKMPLPKGPMPMGRKMEVSSRQMRRKGMG
ncbi:DUF4191 domain-containing protein [Blastococcus sp. Marseille-P5729]|uniref:DUF4191 domain-containing protein n=1 Tax=Blastococcus sp. Marseille-P5729 TaxID=2086582 RepID=UPI000D102DB9|nr:DUF4191 domain-containing protein [Blastococcus sp. Marseille-P5729]